MGFREKLDKKICRNSDELTPKSKTTYQSSIRGHRIFTERELLYLLTREPAMYPESRLLNGLGSEIEFQN